MQDQSLDVVDESLIATGKFLKEFASDPYKLGCLQTFAKCVKVVEWIREETKGYHVIGFGTYVYIVINI